MLVVVVAVQLLIHSQGHQLQTSGRWCSSAPLQRLCSAHLTLPAPTLICQLRVIFDLLFTLSVPAGSLADDIAGVLGPLIIKATQHLQPPGLPVISARCSGTCSTAAETSLRPLVRKGNQCLQPPGLPVNSACCKTLLMKHKQKQLWRPRFFLPGKAGKTSPAFETAQEVCKLLCMAERQQGASFGVHFAESRQQQSCF